MFVQARATGWIGFGIAEGGAMMGADIVYFESSTNKITDAYSLDFVKPVSDDQQDWTLISSSNAGGYITVEAARSIDTRDAQDTKIIDDSWPALDGTRYIAAWGDSATMQYHGRSNRIFGQVRFYNPGPADPLAALKANPAVKIFEIKQDRHPIPVTPATSYDHLCIPLRADWGGPLPLANDSYLLSKRHIVAFEAIVDPTSSSPKGNVHHFVLTCVRTTGVEAPPRPPAPGDPVWYTKDFWDAAAPWLGPPAESGTIYTGRM